MDSKQKIDFLDNPNPNARIGFVIFYPFQFYVQKNIYKHLAKEAEFIIDLGVFFPVEQPLDLLRQIIFLLKKNNAHYRILHYENYYYEESLEKFFSQYKVLVSLWEWGCLNLKCNADKKKVRLGYGSGKELTMYRPSGRIFDLTLAYGKRDYKAFSLFSECKIVGVPKFDDWFNGEFDESFLHEVRERLDANKKTVLYLPTHSDLGSIGDLAEPLKNLTKNYNVIVKLHYFNITDEPELVKKLDHKNIISFKDDVDLLPLMKIADVVLSDNSSAIFDAILADKPVVVTDFLNKDFLDVAHKKLKQYRRGITRAITYSGSIEQTIKRDGLIVTIQNPSQLEEGIKRGIVDDVLYKDARKKINEELVAFTDGKSGERAAREIINLLNSDGTLEKPPLYHALEVYEENIKNKFFLGKKGDVQLITEYENLLVDKIKEEEGEGIFFSVVIISDPTRSKNIEEEFITLTARSILEQKYPAAHYEIIISDNLRKEAIKKISSAKNAGVGIKYITADDNTLCTGAFIHSAIENAAGGIICFIESGCIAPFDWLLNFYVKYKNNADVAGVGGYYLKQRTTSTIFDEYYYAELGRKFGIQKEGFGYLSRLYDVKNTLFYQNPAGMLENMSYKKEALKNLQSNYEKIFSAMLIGLVIKNEVCSEGNSLLFTPSYVTSLEKMSFKRFMQRNFSEGLSYYFLCSRNTNLKQYYGYTFFSVIKLPMLNILDGYQKLKLSIVICIGVLFRWLGKIFGVVVTFTNKLLKES